MTTHPQIPVARPLLPPTDSLLPALRRIESRRTYSNGGPEVRLLEDRLAAHLGTAPGTVAAVANATLGLTLALMASGARSGAPPGGLCLMPAWTFAATAHAAVAAGLRPHFLDVDEATGALTPDDAGRALATLREPVAAVMPVAPFGRPLDVPAWDRLAARTGIPVILDAAAGFDGLRPGASPAVVSLHATKILGAGEGGFVVARDPALARAVEQRANFGFPGTRHARLPALNAKMSEFAAVIGLAALDAWPATRARFAAIASAYARLLRGLPGIRLQGGFGETWVSATVVAEFAHAPADEVAARLAAEGIETRRWWPRGLHEEDAFATCRAEPLPVTERLAARALGLPCYPDMTRAEVARVAAALGRALAPRAGRGPFRRPRLLGPVEKAA